MCVLSLAINLTAHTVQLTRARGYYSKLQWPRFNPTALRLPGRAVRCLLTLLILAALVWTLGATGGSAAAGGSGAAGGDAYSPSTWLTPLLTLTYRIPPLPVTLVILKHGSRL